MKIFPIKIFPPRKYKHVSNMKRTCPMCGTLLEPEDEKRMRCPEGCDLSGCYVSDDDFQGETDSEERKKHREEYRKNPGKYRNIIKKGVDRVRKAFFIDRKV